MKTAVFKAYGAKQTAIDLAISKIKALDEKTRISVICPDQANTVIIIEAENPAGELDRLIADKEMNIGKIVPMYYYGKTTK